MKNQSHSRLSCMSNSPTSHSSIHSTFGLIIPHLPPCDLWPKSVKSHAARQALNFDPPFSMPTSHHFLSDHRISISQLPRDSPMQNSGKILFTISLDCSKDFKMVPNPSQNTELMSHPRPAHPPTPLYIFTNPSLYEHIRNTFLSSQASKGSFPGIQLKNFGIKRGSYPFKSVVRSFSEAPREVSNLQDRNIAFSSAAPLLLDSLVKLCAWFSILSAISPLLCSFFVTFSLFRIGLLPLHLSSFSLFPLCIHISSLEMAEIPKNREHTEAPENREMPENPLDKVLGNGNCTLCKAHCFMIARFVKHFNELKEDFQADSRSKRKKMKLKSNTHRIIRLKANDVNLSSNVKNLPLRHASSKVLKGSF
jgi:hypothetical protein